MTKVSKRRPGSGYASGWDAIALDSDKCQACGELKCKCACMPTDDGPGQDKASQEVKTHYERRRFNREGI